MKFYFDVDDTLYDQFIPFKKAFIEIFPKIKTLPIYQFLSNFVNIVIKYLRQASLVKLQ